MKRLIASLLIWFSTLTLTNCGTVVGNGISIGGTEKKTQPAEDPAESVIEDAKSSKESVFASYANLLFNNCASPLFNTEEMAFSLIVQSSSFSDIEGQKLHVKLENENYRATNSQLSLIYEYRKNLEVSKIEVLSEDPLIPQFTCWSAMIIDGDKRTLRLTDENEYNYDVTWFETLDSPIRLLSVRVENLTLDTYAEFERVE